MQGSSKWIDLSVAVKRIYVNKNKCDTQAFKFPSLMLVSLWLSGRIFDWRFSQPGFDPSFGDLACLATLKSSERTKKVCLWMTIYIYIYIYIYIPKERKTTYLGLTFSQDYHEDLDGETIVGSFWFFRYSSLQQLSGLSILKC